MAFLERLTSRVIIDTVGKVGRRLARDAKYRKKGRAEGRDDVFKLWRSGMTYEQARRKLGQ
jgi:hypothetical protein